MKTLRILALLAALTVPASAITITLGWEDSNPPNFVTKFTLYRKVFSSTGATWQKVKDIPAGQFTTTVEITSGSEVYAISSWAGALESRDKAELVVDGPRAPIGFGVK